MIVSVLGFAVRMWSLALRQQERRSLQSFRPTVLLFQLSPRDYILLSYTVYEVFVLSITEWAGT